MKGRCLCHSGWKGAECDVPTNQCIDVTCSNHGTCITGTCICNPGYKGESCEEGRTAGGKRQHLPVRQRSVQSREGLQGAEGSSRTALGAQPGPGTQQPQELTARKGRGKSESQAVTGEVSYVERILYTRLCPRSLLPFTLKPNRVG